MQGTKRRHTWDQDGKYLLASIDGDDVLSKHEDMEIAVPPEEVSYWWAQAWDDVSGMELGPTKVREAREMEMQYYETMQVYDKVPLSQCWERTGKPPLKARWIDTDKGTRYRSRWVAKQFKGSDTGDWFAATPPIQALRALLSDVACGQGKGLMVCDVSRAFFYAPVQRELCVELCDEAIKEESDKGMCAKLKMSM